MKQKNQIYQPEKHLTSIPLSTLALFRRDDDGLLVYAPLRRRYRGNFNPSVEERRRRRRFPWRKDAHGWIVVDQEWTDAISIRTCEVSAGGCTVLLDQQVEIGTILDIEVEESHKAGILPLAEVIDIQPRGDVWLVRCVWLVDLSKRTLRRLLDKPKKKQHQQIVLPTPIKVGWLTRLWMWFHAA